MAFALNRENFLLHKLHSLTGIIPVGYYMAQHLLLNTFSIAGPDKFNAVIMFFEGMPKFLLPLLEIFAIWLPLAFHAVYGLFITGRASPNFIGTKYGWSQNRMYTFQRYSGVFLFFALIVHVTTTTGVKYLRHSPQPIEFAAWQHKLTEYGYVWTIFYVLLVFFASYHLAYGIWNFCIRWGITISDAAQRRVQKFALVAFAGLTLMGWAAIAGFLVPHASSSPEITESVPASVSTPMIPKGTQPL